MFLTKALIIILLMCWNVTDRMIKTSVYKFNPLKLIEEVKQRPGLYSAEQPADRDEKLQLWKEIGAALYDDWDKFNKATAYDRILTLQRKWRSLRDAYNRELRLRRSGTRYNRRVYIYFKRMSFLGGFDGDLSPEDPDANNEDILFEAPIEDPISTAKPKKIKKKKRRRSSTESEQHHEDVEVAVYPEIGDESESDRLFLMSFLPEMRQLPLNIKMWARTQIANVMQEAVTSHYNSLTPANETRPLEIKRQRDSSSD